LITLLELLEDPKFREFFKTVPKTIKPKEGQMPWRLYVQREAQGPWAKKEFARYADAFRALTPYIRDGRIHDGAIQSRNIAFGPPERIVRLTKGGKPLYAVDKDGKKLLGPDGKPIQRTAVSLWKPKLPADEEEHIWCTYCRRPTVFRWFKTHHSLRRSVLDGLTDPSERRCTICGARESFIRSTVGSARKPGHNPIAVPKRRTRR
jgi:hypothetical protein